MSYQQQLQQDDAPVAFADELDAGDVTSQGETTSVETPEGRPNHPDIELSRGNRLYYDRTHTPYYLIGRP